MQNKAFDQKTCDSKGKVEIRDNNGYLRIQFPRELYEGEQKYLGLGLRDTPENRSKAEATRCEIQRDIDYGEFDNTLEKYRPGYQISSSSKDSTDTSIPETTHLTLSQMLENFEREYFFTRKRTRQSQRTFQQHKDNVIRAFKSKKNLDFYLSNQDI